MQINKEEFIEKCEIVYQQQRKDLERNYSGKIVALHEEGVGAVADTIDSALEQARANHPDKIFYVRKIGDRPAAAILYVI